jgi:hypothetical protein
VYKIADSKYLFLVLRFLFFALIFSSCASPSVSSRERTSGIIYSGCGAADSIVTKLKLYSHRDSILSPFDIYPRVDLVIDEGSLEPGKTYQISSSDWSAFWRRQHDYQTVESGEIIFTNVEPQKIYEGDFKIILTGGEHKQGQFILTWHTTSGTCG